MMQRINFLERQWVVWNYRLLAWAGVVWGALFGVIIGYHGLTLMLLDHEISSVVSEVNQLREQKEEVLAQVEKGSGTMAGGVEHLRSLFQRSPRWSFILEEVAKLIPSDSWLVSIKSYVRSEDAMSRGLLLSGEADDLQSVSGFLKELARSRYFTRPVLTDSKEEKRGNGRLFIYTIDARVTVPEEWGGF
ncbi:MAG: PilN domain-containing protein [Deltaproteobacteria bacterium]|nr:PilN domain-containing protein [Deltaproteobacteria bacterium]